MLTYKECLVLQLELGGFDPVAKISPVARSKTDLCSFLCNGTEPISCLLLAGTRVLIKGRFIINCSKFISTKQIQLIYNTKGNKKNSF
jgi:hypothetical protein